jgi:hypothetical protein
VAAQVTTLQVRLGLVRLEHPGKETAAETVLVAQQYHNALAVVVVALSHWELQPRLPRAAMEVQDQDTLLQLIHYHITLEAVAALKQRSPELLLMVAVLLAPPLHLPPQLMALEAVPAAV